MRPILLLLLFLSCFNVGFSQQPIDSLIKANQITGAQITFVNREKTTHCFGGFADLDEKLKVNEQTIFQAASLSKVVLAYICLEMNSKNLIDLDKPLFNYFAYNRLIGDPDAQKITAKMVLTHTSGLPNWAENPLSKAWGTSILRTNFDPGTNWQYSGEGFVFLQLAIQQILKKDLQQIAVELVFKPLFMKNSSFVWQSRFAEVAAYGYNSKAEMTDRSEFFLPNAAFSLYTTSADYAKFLSALLKRHIKLLANEAVSVDDRAKPNTNAENIFWSLGIGIQKNELGTAFWHWGDNGDFKSFFLSYPEQQKTLVCFTNSTNGLALMQPLFNQYFGKATWFAHKWLQ